MLSICVLFAEADPEGAFKARMSLLRSRRGNHLLLHSLSRLPHQRKLRLQPTSA
jgi:hypothetical protein